ncbi:MAG: FAD-dependent oxidoreductase [Deltaproteobacteria bacterium]|nr:FAD-dependent oxidoreductase [Deltaproteobacteria bacterium]
MSLPDWLNPEKIIPISRGSTTVFKTGTWSGNRPEHREKTSPCRAACPAGNNIPDALFAASQGNFDDALSAFLEESPLPGVCGSVCYHPCETYCNRDKWDGSVHIRTLERAAADYGNAIPIPLANSGERYPVAVVGSGPAGLSAAYHLARMGHPVSVIEARDEAGGLLRFAIPLYRLPQGVFQKDLKRILSLGISINTGEKVGTKKLEEIRAKSSAVFIASGAQRSIKAEIPGLDLEGVLPGLDFLQKVRRSVLTELPGKVVVIGGGNVAVDAARSARRLGADKVEVVCLEQRGDMPAHEREWSDALEEGILFHYGWGPKRFLGKRSRASRVEFAGCTSVFDSKGRFSPSYEEDESLMLDADWVILAIGQVPDISPYRASPLAERGFVQTDPITLATTWEGVFSGGDFVTGPRSVVEAIAAGKRAALSIHCYTLGKPFSEAEERTLLGDGPGFSIHSFFHPREGWDPKSVVRFEDIESLCLDQEARRSLGRLSPVERTTGFHEVDIPLDLREAVQQAGRCFFCGTCTGCDRCFLYCPEVSLLPPDENCSFYRADDAFCKGCAVCAAVCPRGVMTMGEVK